MPYSKRPDAGIMAALRGTTSLTERPLGLVRDEAYLAANEIVMDADCFDEMRRIAIGDLSGSNYRSVRQRIGLNLALS